MPANTWYYPLTHPNRFFVWVCFFTPPPPPPSFAFLPPESRCLKEKRVDEWSSHTMWVADSFWELGALGGNQFICSASVICLDRSLTPVHFEERVAELSWHWELSLKSEWICASRSKTLSSDFCRISSLPVSMNQTSAASLSDEKLSDKQSGLISSLLFCFITNRF